MKMSPKTQFNKTEILQNLQSNIKRLRWGARQTQEEMAQSLKIERNKISQYERGVRQVPIWMASMLSSHFGVTIDEMVNQRIGHQRAIEICLNKGL